jgi:DNA segregation ATPase FtsK/SpoIIIE, S-DNA-T family
MARKSTSKTTQKQFSKLNFTLTNSQKLVVGSFLVILGILLFIALLSYLFTGESDQSVFGDFTNRAVETNNWLSKVGAWVSQLLIYKGFGISSFIFSGLLFLSGISVLANSSKKRLWRNWFWGTILIIWGSMLFGFAFDMAPKLGGVIGYELNLLLQDYIGKIGTALLLIFYFIVYIALRFKVGTQQIAHLFVRTKKELQSRLGF